MEGRMKTAIAILILTTSLMAADNYERSRQCAIQAEKIGNSHGAVLERSHYSPKYQRCFMVSRFRFDSRFGIAEGHERTLWQLKDAFEDSELASKMWYEDDNKTFCRIGKAFKLTPCPEYEDYVEEHISQ
jgi:hypothetical protein